MENKKGLSIKTKIVLVIGVCMLFVFAFIYFASSNIILKSYVTLDEQKMESGLNSTENIFNNFISELSLKVADWAVWDDAYSFASDQNKKFIETNLTGNALSILDINAIIFINAQNEIVYSLIENFDETSTYSDTSSTNKLSEYLKNNINHFHFFDPSESFWGIIPFGNKRLIIAAKPIVKSNGEGPVNGTIIFGKFINDDYVKNLELLAQLSIDILPYDLATTTDFIQAKEYLSKGNKYFVNILSDHLIAGYFQLYDINNNPTLIVKVNNDRTIYKQGVATYDLFMEIMLTLIIMVGFIILIYINFFVSNRIIKLNTGISSIAKENDTSKRLQIKGNDEISILGYSINNLLEQIDISRTALNKKVSELDKNNSELEDSKKAIMNLLEDIEKEKESIEAVVAVRTKELSDEKSRLLASINSLSFGFIIADTESKVILSNPSVLKILDTKKAPKTIDEIAGLFKDFDLISSCKECLQNQKVVEIKEVIVSSKYLRVFCAPIFNVVEIIGHVIIIEDITEAKVLERSKDEFFSIASHELKTPLTAIRGNADTILSMYLDKMPNNDAKEMLRDIENASVRLINIVNDFLEVSKLEQGQILIKKDSFNISDLITKVIKDLQKVAEQKETLLKYDLPKFPISNVIADRDRVEQVLVNLIGNAIKFTDKGNVTVSTEISGNFLIVRIKDTGLGIPLKNQSLLFRKFQQASEKILVRSDSNSTGLGLYISKLLVSKMGGEIKLEKSIPGEGSTFSFTLPLAK